MQAQHPAVKHYQRAIIFQEKGKLSSAERSFKKAIEINRNFIEAHICLGNLFLERGRLRESVNAFQKALKLLPDHPMLLTNVGNVLQLQGENEKAVTILNKAISKDPDNAYAYNNLGNALKGLDRKIEALAAYKRTVKINPELAIGHYNLGLILVELEELDEAIDCFNQALRINPADKKAYLGLGNARSAQGDLNQAISAYQKAIAIDPRYEIAYKDMAKAFADHGEIEQALHAIRKALEVYPEYAKAYLSLSRNKKFTEYDDDIRAMESLMSNRKVSDQDSVYLAHALGKAYEDIGNFDKSIEYVIQATRINRNSYDYSISESQEEIDNIKKLFSSDFLSSHRDSGYPDRTPIFIVGMPRSGTSLVEQILASHPDVYGAGELKDLGKVIGSIKPTVQEKKPGTYLAELPKLDARTFSDLGQQYISRIRKYSADARFITDKMPGNFLYIGFIKAILPNARVIHCTRDPMDTCLSILKTKLKKTHGYANDMSELGQYYRMYLELMEYWRDTLPGFVYDQSYEQLVGSQQEQVEKLLQHCDLQWADACLNFHKTRRKVKTASNAQVRRPIYNDSVNLWKRYEKQLDPLRAAIYGGQ